MDISVKEAVENGLQAVEEKLGKTLAEHTAEVEKYGKASTELSGKLDDLSAAFAEMKQAQDVVDESMREMAQKAAGGYAAAGPETKSVGDQFISSDEFRALRENLRPESRARVEIKNTISQLTGSPAEVGTILVQAERQAGVVPGAVRALNVLDIIPQGVTSRSTVEFVQEASWTNAAAEAQEAAAKAESTLTFSTDSEIVRTIAHFLKMSNQSLEDAPYIASYVNGRLIHGLRHRLQQQILAGNGTAPNLSGMSDSGNYTAYTAVTGDTALDSLNKAKYACIGSDFAANYIVLNPEDFGAIERLGITGGQYLGGDGGSLSYIQTGFGVAPVIWGLPVVLSNDVSSGYFYLFDNSAVQLVTRQGVTVDMGFVNADFTNNLVTIRAELRAAFMTYQPLAVRYGALTV